MNIFIDTSTEFCRIWLDGQEFKKELGRKMAFKILEFIEECLNNKNIKYQDLDGIGFFAGPGSFTGLRIGATVVNTLSDSLKIPVVAVHQGSEGGVSTYEEWLKFAELRLKNDENDKIAMPFYGRDARITKPRK